MKELALLLNIALLGSLAYVLIAKGAPGREEVSVLVLIVLCGLAPVASMYALWRSNPNSQGWLSLLLQRKALEEQRKIEALRK